jgi:hypothetical protein
MVCRQIVNDFDTRFDLPNHSVCSREDNVVELRNKTEKIGVEGHTLSDAKMEILNVIVGLESVHVHRDALGTNFFYPEADNVTLMEDQELATGSWIQNPSDALLDQATLNWYFIGGKKAQGKITTQN